MGEYPNEKSVDGDDRSTRLNPQTPPDKDFPGRWVASQSVLRSFVFGAIFEANDAEDVLQEVARAAFASFDAYDPARPFTPWVMTIARRRVADYLKKRSAQPVAFDSETLEALGAAHERLDDTAAERRAALARCMTLVHDRGRLAIELRYRDELTVAAIADRLDTTPHAVSNLLNRVRASLAECIQRKIDEGGISGGDA